MTSPEESTRGHAELEGDDPTITIPAGTGTFIKRAAAFALCVLAIYLILVTQTQSRQNGKAIDTLEKSQGQIIAELQDAREDRAELLKLLKERGVEVTNLGDVDGDGDVDYTVRTLPTPAPAPTSTTGSAPTQTKAPQAPRATAKPANSPDPKPAQSPKPPPPPITIDEPREEDRGVITEKPIVGCVDGPLGRACI